MNLHKHSKPYTIGSLFSGIGGIELGFKKHRFQTKWFIESNLYCQQILRKHWPRIPIHYDITTINFKALPKVDILTGGFPCQDISTANPNAEGIQGSRSGLWRYFAKAIQELQPRMALIENVPALKSRGLHIVLNDLAKAGYDAEWFTLRACDYGLPHKRERLFIVAYTTGKLNSRLQQEAPEIFKHFREEISRGTLATWKHELSEPVLLGTGHVFPKRMDRTKAIGNAVCPIIATFIAKWIKNYLNQTSQSKTTSALQQALSQNNNKPLKKQSIKGSTSTTQSLPKSAQLKHNSMTMKQSA